MKTRIQRLIILFVLTAAGLSATACNTTRGFGEDVEKVGEEIKEGTR